MKQNSFIKTAVISICILFSGMTAYAISNLYGNGGSITDPTVWQTFTQSGSIHMSFSSQIGNSYRAYVCPASLSPESLTGTDLENFFIIHSSVCNLAFSGTALSTSTSTSLTGLAVWSYKLHVIDGCAPSIVDTEAPIMTLVGSGTLDVYLWDIYTELWATWTDNEDGSGSMVVASSGSVDTNTLGTYNLEYTYTDQAGNISNTVTRTVNIIKIPDTEAPVVSLVWSGDMDIYLWETYTELWAAWTDNEDGSGSIVVASSGSVDTNTLGTYNLEYTYTDQAGNISNTVTRTVNIISAPVLACTIGSGEQKVLEIIDSTHVKVNGNYITGFNPWDGCSYTPSTVDVYDDITNNLLWNFTLDNSLYDALSDTSTAEVIISEDAASFDLSHARCELLSPAYISCF